MAIPSSLTAGGCAACLLVLSAAVAAPESQPERLLRFPLDEKAMLVLPAPPSWTPKAKTVDGRIDGAVVLTLEFKSDDPLAWAVEVGGLWNSKKAKVPFPEALQSGVAKALQRLAGRVVEPLPAVQDLKGGSVTGVPPRSARVGRHVRRGGSSVARRVPRLDRGSVPVRSGSVARCQRRRTF